MPDFRQTLEELAEAREQELQARKRYKFTLDEEVHERISAAAEFAGITKSEIVEALVIQNLPELQEYEDE